MGDFTIPIFPEGSLSASITTTVWVGVWIVVLANSRLGWPLTGLVVPGYLAPLLLAKPMSAAVVICEAVVTYAIVWALSERFNRLSFWCSLFGRDRFFAFVLISILVRAVMDGWFLPWLGPAVNEAFGWQIDYRNHLHSYGLIIVSLIANYFWKPGLLRGGAMMAVTMFATLLLVRYVLIGWTNYNVGSLQYVYEDIASSLLASPKAYIILVSTAWFASTMNLRYSWDYNGILVPALLALQWSTPYKIFFTFCEAGMILGCAALVLKLPIWQRTTVEGGRKILLFFNISFLYRMALGFVLPLIVPEVKVTDFFGFGYLLATLLAMRAYDKGTAVRLVRASLQVSLLGAIGGSTIGFLLTKVPDTWLLPSPDLQDANQVTYEVISDSLTDVLRRDQLLLFEKQVPDSFSLPTETEMSLFGDGVRRLLRYRQTRSPDDLAYARRRLATVNYSVHEVSGRFLYLRENSPPNGWGLYALTMNADSPLLLSVPAPMEEWGTIDSACTLMEKFSGNALAVAGAPRSANHDGSSDVLNTRNTLFGVFHQIVHRGSTLQVRAVERDGFQMEQQPNATSRPSSLWIRGGLPNGLELGALNQMLPVLRVHWQSARSSNMLRDHLNRGFAELFLTHQDRRQLLISHLRNSQQAGAGFRTERLSVQTWLLDQKQHVAGRGSQAYRPPTLQDLLYLDTQVLRPLSTIAQQYNSAEELSPALRDELTAIGSAASVVGMELLLIHDPQQKDAYVALREPPGEAGKRCWGTYVYRMGMQESVILEVPRPIYEHNSLEFAAASFTQLRASAIAIAGAHPQSNADGSADVLRASNKWNVFSLWHQTLLRDLGSRPMLVAQSRAIRAPVAADILVSTDDGARTMEDLSPLKSQLVDALTATGLEVMLANGAPDTAGYEMAGTLLSATLNQTDAKELVTLWLSPFIRSAFRQSRSDDLESAQFDTLGIETTDSDLFAHLHEKSDLLEPSVPAEVLTEPVCHLLKSYLESRDIVLLRKLQVEYPHLSLSRVVQTDSRQTYLVLVDAAHPRSIAAVKLTHWPTTELSIHNCGDMTRDVVDQFHYSPMMALQIGAAP
ncbi:MAG: poly-gamma-glutamate biosynthesis protein PgsC/CapC [Pirellulaceae bacterium]